MSENIQSKNKEEKPFNFWGFMLLMLIALVVLASIILGIPYLIEHIK